MGRNVVLIFEQALNTDKPSPRIMVDETSVPDTLPAIVHKSGLTFGAVTTVASGENDTFYDATNA